jgi:peptidoglycan/LPS O-acetylase OafA/YrhL
MDIPIASLARSAYRADIDGLRAVAILLVLFDHVGITAFSGGFIGVDVFFVISGYLISDHMLKQLEAGSFSFARFYERRFRRIIPALLFILAATTIMAYRYLFPTEMIEFGKSLLAALLSYSNIHFWLLKTDYFVGLHQQKPLLHTWSLGVEEQLYIVFPLLLVALYRFGAGRWPRRHLKGILWAVTVLSFGLACFWTTRDASTAFFLMPLRAWEFLMGALLAVGALPSLKQAWLRNLASAIGLLLIVLPGILYTSKVLFPGVAALLPCLGAALIIAAGEVGSSWIGNALAFGPLRWVGLISYSLYLWHWPVQVFQTTNFIIVPDRDPLWMKQVAVIAVSLLLAALSWRFVEQPFRTGRLRARVPLFVLNGGLLLCLVWFSNILIQYAWWPPAYLPRTTAFNDFHRTAQEPGPQRWNTCFMDAENYATSFKPSICLADDPNRKHYLLLGDSHAGMMYVALKATFPKLNLSQLNITRCRPTIHHPAWASSPGCVAATQFTFGDYLQHHSVDMVLLAGRWEDGEMDDLSATITWLQQHGIKTIVIGPGIEFDQSFLRLLEVSHRDHDPGMLARHRSVAPEQLDRRMEALARDKWNVPYISMYDDLCGNTAGLQGETETVTGCPVYAAPGVPLLWDSDHLSLAGSLLFADKIKAGHQLQ